MTAPTDALRALADRVERLAFQMPAPNEWTPQFVEIAIAARSALADYPMTEPRTIDAKGLRELLEKATPGPWGWYWRVIDGNADCGVFWEKHVGHHQSVCRAPRYETEDQWKANAALIVAAVNALPALLSELDRLRGEVAGLREDAALLDWAHDHAHALTWNNDGERIVIRGHDDARFTGETWREAIRAAIKESTNGQG